MTKCETEKRHFTDIRQSRTGKALNSVASLLNDDTSVTESSRALKKPSSVEPHSRNRRRVSGFTSPRTFSRGTCVIAKCPRAHGTGLRADGR